MLEVTWNSLPEMLKKSFLPDIISISKEEVENGQMMYKWVCKQSGPGGYKDRGYVVQICPSNGQGLTRIALVSETIVGALLAIAASMDERLTLQMSAHSWILYMVKEGDPAVERWLSELSE